MCSCPRSHLRIPRITTALLSPSCFPSHSRVTTVLLSPHCPRSYKRITTAAFSSLSPSHPRITTLLLSPSCLPSHPTVTTELLSPFRPRSHPRITTVRCRERLIIIIKACLKENTYFITGILPKIDKVACNSIICLTYLLMANRRPSSVTFHVRRLSRTADDVCR